MKHFAVIILLSLNIYAFSQNFKDALQGDWVCTQILDSNGKKTIGKFGDSDEFLKYSFSKSDMSIIEAPFDIGVKLTIKFENDYIDLFPGAVFELPERIYTIKSINDSNLVLTTKDENKKPIDYYFIKQTKLIDNEDIENRLIDIGFIAVKHQRSSKDEIGANRVSEYRILNNKENLQPCPKFIDANTATFGDYFSINYKFPKSYQLDAISDELIVEFNVSGKGVSDIKIIQGINDEMNAAVIKTIEGTTKKWQALEIDDRPIKTTLRLHFIFYLGFTKMPNIFIK